MLNSLTKITVILAAAVALTSVGCKKDESYAQFTLQTSSMDFEWGQTKRISYTSNKVGGFSQADVPKGWTCVHRGGYYDITAPQQSADADLQGSFSLTAVTDEGSTLTRNVTVAVRIAEDISARAANSIIVSEPGRRYKFNARRRADETAETLTAAANATRLWSTSKTAIVNVSLENGYLYFATGASNELEEANCVVAATDGDGNVLWSWHIWATAYDPAATPDVVGNLRVMNRNLGAFAASDATPGEAVRSYGLYYQWGRKDPFVGPRTWNSSIPVSTYADGSSGYAKLHEYVVSDKDKGTVEYATAHPNTFIAGGSEDNGYDWTFAAGAQGRWSASSKTLYDPCPAGWRVAPASIWRGFTATGRTETDPAQFNVEGEYTYGWTFRNGEGTIFYPAAGRRSFSRTLANTYDNFTNVVNDRDGVGYPVGFYWSADYPVATDATTLPDCTSLVFRRDYVNPAYRVAQMPEGAPAGGFPLRCVAE